MNPHYLRGVGVVGLAGAGDLSCTPRDARRRVLTVFTMNRRQKRVNTIMTTLPEHTLGLL